MYCNYFILAVARDFIYMECDNKLEKKVHASNVANIINANV